MAIKRAGHQVKLVDFNKSIPLKSFNNTSDSIVKPTEEVTAPEKITKNVVPSSENIEINRQKTKTAVVEQPSLIKDIPKKGVTPYKHKPDGSITSVMLSRITKDIYETFEIRDVPTKHSFPVRVVIPEDKERHTPKMEKFVLYDDQEDFVLIHHLGLLTELDTKILAFIAKFQNVQLYHLIKEFSGQKGINQAIVKRSLNKLKEFLFIKEQEFKRFDDKAPEDSKAKCFIATRNGMTYLKENSLVPKDEAFRWLNRHDEDSLNPIRLWKICDAYQVVSHLSGFVNFKSRTLIKGRTYDRPSSKKGKKRNIPIYLKQFWINGEIEMKARVGNEEIPYYFDLYPYIDSEKSTDSDNLGLALQHFGLLKKDRDEARNNYKRGKSVAEKMLVIIVDDWEVASKIIYTHHLDTYSGLVSFLDLSTVQNENLLESIVRFSKVKDPSTGEVQLNKDGTPKMAWQPLPFEFIE